MTLKLARMNAFRAWLENAGAKILPAGNALQEAARVRTSIGTLVLIQTRDGREVWPPDLLDLLAKFAEREAVQLAPFDRARPKSRLAERYDVLVKRDGPECFYCGHTVEPPGSPVPAGDEASIEHLVSFCHGGPNHLANAFLAHRECNAKAGHLSAAEKIARRDKLRNLQ